MCHPQKSLWLYEHLAEHLVKTWSKSKWFVFVRRAYRFGSCPKRLQSAVQSFSQLHQSVVQLKVQAQQQTTDTCPHSRLFFFIIIIFIFIALHSSLPLTPCRMKKCKVVVISKQTLFIQNWKRLYLVSESKKKEANLIKYYVTIRFSNTLWKWDGAKRLAKQKSICAPLWLSLVYTFFNGYFMIISDKNCVSLSGQREPVWVRATLSYAVWVAEVDSSPPPPLTEWGAHPDPRWSLAQEPSLELPPGGASSAASGYPICPQLCPAHHSLETAHHPASRRKRPSD